MKGNIQIGAVFWLTIKTGLDENAIPHPYVVIEDSFLTHTKNDSLFVCRITTNMKKRSWPSTILLEKGEADLPKESLIDTSQLVEIHSTELGEFIGTLNENRIQQITSKRKLMQSLVDKSSSKLNE